MASYPTTTYSPSAKSNGQTIQAAWFNDPDGEIAAIEAAMISTGLAHVLKPAANNTYDLGVSGTAWRDLFIGRNATIGGTLAVTGATTLGTLGGHLLFTDATYDIGASGATRPRDLFLSRNATIGGTVVVTGGQIAFPATQSASANANTLDDYEEGTWTPIDASGAGLSLTTEGRYVKVGQFVMASCHVTYPTTANGSGAAIGGLPFESLSTSNNMFGGMVSYSTYATPFTCLILTGTTSMQLFAFGGGAVTNANLTGATLRITATYRASA